MHCHKRVISVFLKLSSLSLYFRLRMAQPFFVHSPPARLCLLYTNPLPGICDVCQSALGGLFPSGSFLPPRQRFFELFLHPLIFSYISFSSGLLWYFLIVIHGITSSLDMPVSVIRVVHDALCH